MSLRFPSLRKVGVRVIAGFVLAVGAGSVAQAQQCDCAVPLAGLPTGQAIGQLTAVSGQVNVLGGNGWTSASSGTPIFVGSQIETAAGSSASLSVPGCALNVGALSSVALAPVNQSLCLTVAQAAPAPGVNPGGGALGAAPANSPVVAGMAAGIGVIAGTVAVATDDGSPASP